MPFFLDRNRTGPDPLLPWKVGAFVVGAGLGFLGIYLENDWLVGAGTAVVFAGVLLRAWGGRERVSFGDPGPEKGAEEAGDESERPA